MPALLSFLWSAPYIQKGIETESWEKVRALLADMMCRASVGAQRATWE